jgi:mannose-6-phosphate isomerase-like protein (cupin superfamily)
MRFSEHRRGAFKTDSADGKPIHVITEDVTIKISSRDTGGAFTVFEGRTRPQSGPPLHRHHHEDEYWFIVEGAYKFVVDGEEIYAGAGDTVFAPRGSSHTFQNIGSEPGRTITTVIPGGVDLFFEELEKAVPRGVAPDPDRMLPVFDRYGLELLGPPLAPIPLVGADGAD